MRAWVLLLLLVVPAAAEPHGPIRIVSDNDFLTPGNGVSSGAGTPDDPFIIEGWEIQPDLLDLTDRGAAIHIEATEAHVVLRDITVQVPFAAGVRVLDAANVTFQDVLLENQREGFWADGASDLRIERIRASSSGANAFNLLLTDSHRVLVRGADLEGEGPGLQVTGGRFLRLEGVRVEAHDGGIRIQGASDVALVSVVAQDNRGDGVWLRNLTRLDVRGLDALRNQESQGANTGRGLVAWNVAGSFHDVHMRGNDATGLFLLESTASVTSGQMLDNAVGVYQEGARGDLRDLEAHGNRQEGILVVGHGGSWLGQALRIHDNGATGLHIQGVDVVDLSDIRSESNRVGIIVRDGNVTLAGATLLDNDVGLGLLNVGGEVRGVLASQNDIGVQAFAVHGLTLDGNEARDNAGDGFDLHGQDITVRDNHASGNAGYGIRVRDGSNATLTDNELVGNGLGGLSGEVQQESPGPWLLPVLLVALALRVLHQRP